MTTDHQERPPRRVRGTCRSGRPLAWLPAAVFLASAAAVGAQPVLAAPQQFTLFASQKRLLAMMRVGTAPPFPVVFDTGTNDNILDVGLADRLGLPNTGPSQSADGQGRPDPGHATVLRGATVGGVAIPDGPASAIAYNLPDEVGIIGPDSFPGRVVRVEPTQTRVEVLERTAATLPRCAGHPYSGAFSFNAKPDDILPTTEVHIGTLTVVAEVDTGNTAGLFLPSSLIGKVPLEAPPVAAGYAQSVTGREPLFKARVATDVTIDQVVLHHPAVAFAASHKPNVGLAVLRSFTLVFDPTGQRDWLIPAGHDPVTCGPAGRD